MIFGAIATVIQIVKEIREKKRLKQEEKNDLASKQKPIQLESSYDLLEKEEKGLEDRSQENILNLHGQEQISVLGNQTTFLQQSISSSYINQISEGKKQKLFQRKKVEYQDDQTQQEEKKVITEVQIYLKNISQQQSQELKKPAVEQFELASDIYPYQDKSQDQNQILQKNKKKLNALKKTSKRRKKFIKLKKESQYLQDKQSTTIEEIDWQ